MSKQQETIRQALLWKFLERFGCQFLGFFLNLMLARLLLPEQYGIVSLITVFATIGNVFVQGGFNTALIQKQNPDELDYSTVLFFSLGISACLYGVLFACAPLIASFYHAAELTLVMRVFSLSLIFGAVNSIQVAYVTKQMEFKKLFRSSVLAIIFSGSLGIFMALRGCGVWSLVTQQLMNQALVVVVMFFTISWRPKKQFSLNRMKSLFRFGGMILASNLLTTIFMEVRSLLIGRIYSPTELGYFNRGKQFPDVLLNNVNGSIQSVMLVAYSEKQENREAVKALLRKSMMMCSYLVFPLMIGLAVVAKPVVSLLLTDKWLPCVPVMQVYCIIYMLMPLHTANIQAIKGLGYSGLLLKVDILRKAIELILLLISLQRGIVMIAIGGLIANILSLFLNLYPCKKLLGYRFRDQFLDTVSGLWLSLAMAGCVYAVTFLALPPVLSLVWQLFVGIVVYLFLSFIFPIKAFRELRVMLSPYLHRKKQRNLYKSRRRLKHMKK